MKIVDYDATRRSDVAELMGRVWGDPGDEQELKWFYEGNPVAPASVLLAEEDDRVVATVAMSFLRMSIGGEELTVGMPLRVATDVLPLLVHACSDGYICRLPQPAEGYVQSSHTGGNKVRQPPQDQGYR